MSQSESHHIFVELRMYRFDPDKDGGALPPATGPGIINIDQYALEFRNLAQSSHVYEDAYRVLLRAMADGKHELEERPKPGRKKAGSDGGPR